MRAKTANRLASSRDRRRERRPWSAGVRVCSGRVSLRFRVSIDEESAVSALGREPCVPTASQSRRNDHVAVRECSDASGSDRGARGPGRRRTRNGRLLRRPRPSHVFLLRSARDVSPLRLLRSRTRGHHRPPPRAPWSRARARTWSRARALARRSLVIISSSAGSRPLIRRASKPRQSSSPCPARAPEPTSPCPRPRRSYLRRQCRGWSS